MTNSLENYENGEEFEITDEEMNNFFLSIFGKTLSKQLEEYARMTDEEREKMNRSVEDDYVAVFDLENYPPESIIEFEGHPMVPSRLVAERMRQLRETKKG